MKTGCWIKKYALALTLVHFASALCSSEASQRIEVIRAADSGVKLVANADFEQEPLKGGAWVNWGQGFEWLPGQGRSGSAAIRFTRSEGQGEFGMSQTLVLNRTNIAPFTVRGWSKAINVSGSSDNGYSLYVDIIYMDGTPLWGRTAPFNCGTHDWEFREFVILPERPVKSITLHCLLRGHTGSVLFDDVSLEEVQTPAGTTLLQGLPVKLTAQDPARRGKRQVFSTKDHLELAMANDRIVSVKVSGEKLGGGAPSGFLACDYAAHSDFFGFQNGQCRELGLSLRTEVIAKSNYIVISGSLKSDRKQDRAVTLLFALPIQATGMTWGDDVRKERKVEGSSEFLQTIPVRSGPAQRISRYPFGAVWNNSVGIALGMNMEHPAQYTIACNPQTKQFYLAYDFGLSPDTRKSPSEARFEFVLYRFDPKWGFRAALEKYYEIFPEHFRKRVSKEGVWMPFTDISQVPGFQDFGFGFQEGAPNVAFDDMQDIASFVYVEPASHWLSLPPGVPRTYDTALAVLTTNLSSGDAERRRMASATLSSGIHQKNGQFSLYLVKAPWCDGGMFTLNPHPDVPTNSTYLWNKATVMQKDIADAFARNEPRTNSTARHPGLDGVYFDSLEMSCADLNYRREHFAASGVPLVFDSEGQVCQMMMFNTWEFVRAMASSLHSRGKLTFANGALWNFSFPAPLLDVMGTEANWVRNGVFTPDTDATMNFRRAMCYQKPYCLLMNTDYSKMKPDMVQRYFELCLFYGVWPGFFDEDAASKDPYWGSKSAWYERDRPLFKKYIPMLKKVTSAGWEPVTYARSDKGSVWVERYGAAGSSDCLLTVHNSSETAEHVTVSFSPDLKKFARKSKLVDLVSGEQISKSEHGVELRLEPHQTMLLE